MIAASYLKTNTLPAFDAFVANPNIEAFKQIDQESFKKIIQVI